jgi:hypothetical protein
MPATPQRERRARPDVPSVEFELERDGNEVVISARSGGDNFVMTLPLDGASAFAAAAQQIVDDNKFRSHRARFTVSNAVLQVSK